MSHQIAYYLITCSSGHRSLSKSGGDFSFSFQVPTRLSDYSAGYSVFQVQVVQWLNITMNIIECQGYLMGNICV